MSLNKDRLIVTKTALRNYVPSVSVREIPTRVRLVETAKTMDSLLETIQLSVDFLSGEEAQELRVEVIQLATLLLYSVN